MEEKISILKDGGTNENIKKLARDYLDSSYKEDFINKVLGNPDSKNKRKLILDNSNNFDDIVYSDEEFKWVNFNFRRGFSNFDQNECKKGNLYNIILNLPNEASYSYSREYILKAEKENLKFLYVSRDEENRLDNVVITVKEDELKKHIKIIEDIEDPEKSIYGLYNYDELPDFISKYDNKNIGIVPEATDRRKDWFADKISLLDQSLVKLVAETPELMEKYISNKENKDYLSVLSSASIDSYNDINNKEKDLDYVARLIDEKPTIEDFKRVMEDGESIGEDDMIQFDDIDKSKYNGVVSMVAEETSLNIKNELKDEIKDKYIDTFIQKYGDLLEQKGFTRSGFLKKEVLEKVEEYNKSKSI